MQLRPLFLVCTVFTFGCPSRDFRTNVTVPDNWVINSFLDDGILIWGSIEGRTTCFGTENLNVCAAVKTHDNDSISIWLHLLAAEPATVLPGDILLKTETLNQSPSSVSIIRERWGPDGKADSSPAEVLHLQPDKKVLIKLMYQTSLPDKFWMEIGGIAIDGLLIPIPPVHFRLEKHNVD